MGGGVWAKDGQMKDTGTENVSVARSEKLPGSKSHLPTVVQVGIEPDAATA